MLCLGAASACGYTWGIEHAPLISGPGPGSHWIRIDGAARRYDVDLHLPHGAAGGPIPLVIVLHGYSGTGPGMERRTRFSEIADREGFAVAYPNGQLNAQGHRSWTGGAPSSPDVAMLRALVDSVNRREPVDRDRVYLAGFSNGGMMTYRAAVAMPELFAAIGVVAGNLTMLTADDPGARPIPLIAVHGMRDGTVPFDSPSPAASASGVRRTSSAPRSVRTWARRNGCAEAPRTDTLPGSGAIRTAYLECRGNAEALLYAMPNGGHGWPTAHTREAPFATSEALWRFFAQHRMRDSLVRVDRRQ
jgi:polyhydroxybutyrate depolymerase